MKTFAQWLDLPENDHMKVDYEKADIATQNNFRLFWLGGTLAMIAEIKKPLPLSQREAQEILIQNG